MAQIHHSMNHDFEGPWPSLFGATTTILHSVFLGDKSRRDSGNLELVVIDGSAPPSPSQAGPAQGFFLLAPWSSTPTGSRWSSWTTPEQFTMKEDTRE